MGQSRSFGTAQTRGHSGLCGGDDWRRRNGFSKPGSGAKSRLARNDNRAVYGLAANRTCIGRIKVSEIVIVIAERRMVFPTEAIIERERLREFEVILRKERVVFGVGVRGGVQDGGDGCRSGYPNKNPHGTAEPSPKRPPVVEPL